MTLLTFPALPGVIYPVTKTPQWKTDFQRSFSGKVSTLARYSYPLYRWELGYDFLRTAAAKLEYQTLLAFYNRVNGRAIPWKFVDPDDGSVTTQSFGTGDGATTEFQLLRSITGTGANIWLDPVFAPLTSTIYDNGSALSTPANYSINATGLVTFAVAPVAGHALTWTGTFAWICRFAEDSATFEQFTYNLWELKKIAFDSEKI
jgi:uncharacterized protein (TIGR02217 family)